MYRNHNLRRVASVMAMLMFFSTILGAMPVDAFARDFESRLTQSESQFENTTIMTTTTTPPAIGVNGGVTFTYPNFENQDNSKL